jgi:hypothetical protein
LKKKLLITAMLAAAAMPEARAGSEDLTGFEGNPAKIAWQAIDNQFDPADCPAISRTKYYNGTKSILALCTNGAVFVVHHSPKTAYIFSQLGLPLVGDAFAIRCSECKWPNPPTASSESASAAPEHPSIKTIKSPATKPSKTIEETPTTGWKKRPFFKCEDC